MPGVGRDWFGDIFKAVYKLSIKTPYVMFYLTIELHCKSTLLR